MASKFSKKQPDFNKLRSILLTSGLQQRDNPTYQVINTLLDIVSRFQALTNTSIEELQSNAGGKGGGFIGIGPPGLDGMDGEDGFMGADGARGPEGPAGAPGVTTTIIVGVPGIDGIDGEDGIDGLNGLTGPQGLQGVNGINGTNGQTGPPGIDGEEPELPYIIPGERGPAGAAGGGGGNFGTAILDFSTGKTEAEVDVPGQSGFISSSKVNCWVHLVTTADHSVDEHEIENLGVKAFYKVDGTFTIRGRVVPFPQLIQINSGVVLDRERTQKHLLKGQFNIAWNWAA